MTRIYYLKDRALENRLRNSDRTFWPAFQKACFDNFVLLKCAYPTLTVYFGGFYKDIHQDGSEHDWWRMQVNFRLDEIHWEDSDEPSTEKSDDENLGDF